MAYSIRQMAAALGVSKSQMRNRESIVPTIDCEAEETDRAVKALESRLRATVEVEYLQGWSLRRKAQHLACGEPTVKARVWQAHQHLSRWLSEKAHAARVERERLERMVDSLRTANQDAECAGSVVLHTILSRNTKGYG